jgi:hypothetical protein
VQRVGVTDAMAKPSRYQRWRVAAPTCHCELATGGPWAVMAGNSAAAGEGSRSVGTSQAGIGQGEVTQVEPSVGMTEPAGGLPEADRARPPAGRRHPVPRPAAPEVDDRYRPRPTLCVETSGRQATSPPNRCRSL